MLRRRSIRLRILVLVLAPVVALVGLYAVILDLTIGQYLGLTQASTVRKAITQPVMRVQGALAAERGLALEYLAAPDHGRMLGLLLDQEAKTDTAIRQFDAVATTVLPSADSREQIAIGVLRSDLAGLTPLRTAVEGFGPTLSEAATAYSSKITDGNNVLIQAMLPLVSNTAGLQASNVVALNASLQTLIEESDLLKADLTARFRPGELQLIAQLAAQRRDLWNEALPGLDPVYQRHFNDMVPSGAAATLQIMEGDIAVGPRAASALSAGAWTSAETAYAHGMGRAVLASESGLVATAAQETSSLLTRLLLTAILGLLAIGIAVSVAIVVSRRLIRDLDDLRLSALSLASEGLPGAIERLRAGEAIETDSQAMLDSSADEIGQVRLAFNTAARTAIAAAVEEIKIRRSVNDVFRNLARRNQSLLTRQLELLDAMERRVHDPEELADLFRIDHMTTRMRRHAEGLLIVAGSSSGRSWREPVPLVDVMRAAIAEVENYTRVRVSSRTNGALAGHAVADLIHLIAELVENATMFSPANTPVRIEGDKVARGLSLEIEDRGLGMTEEKLAEMNAKLSNPPMFDLSGSDQLGLFIAGQLARRHDIKITLRGSPYGGITAVVLIPNSLVADVDVADRLPSVSIRELGGRPVPQLPGPSPTPALDDDSTEVKVPVAALDPPASQSQIVAGMLTSLSPRATGSQDVPVARPVALGGQLDDVPAATERSGPPALPNTAALPLSFDPVQAMLTRPPSDIAPEVPATSSPLADTAGGPVSSGSGPLGSGASPGDRTPGDRTLGDRAPGSAASPLADTAGGSAGSSAQPAAETSAAPDSEAKPAVIAAAAPPIWPGVKQGTSSPPPGGTTAFDGLPVRRPGGTGASWPGNGHGTAEASWPSAPSAAESLASEPPATEPPATEPPASGRPTGSRPSRAGVSRADRAVANSAPGGAGSPLASTAAQAEGTVEAPAALPDTDDLPVRVRQASLAPQLMASHPGRSHDAQAAPRDHEATSPEVARNIMAAMQRGWERGRAAGDQGAEPVPADPGGHDDGQPQAAPEQAAPEHVAPGQSLPGLAAPEPASPGPAPSDMETAVKPGGPTISGGAA